MQSLASGINVSLMYDQESRCGTAASDLGRHEPVLGLRPDQAGGPVADHRPSPPVVYAREFENNRSSERAQDTHRCGHPRDGGKDYGAKAKGKGGKSRDGKGRPNNAFVADHVEDQAASVYDGGQDVSIEDHDKASNEVDDNIDDDHEEELVEDDADNGDIGDALAEAAQVLTVTARRLQGVTLGRKFSGKPKSREERKRNSHCAVCGQCGHWKGVSACPRSAQDPNGKTDQRPRHLDQLLHPAPFRQLAPPPDGLPRRS